MTKSLFISFFALTGFFLDSVQSDIELCVSSATDSTYEYIDHIRLNEIDNRSGNNEGYADFTNLVAQLRKGESYQMTLTPGYAGQEFNESWKVWIDYNQDGIFDEEDEEVVSAREIGEIKKDIIIPAHAMQGTTVMRVSMRYNNPAAPCQIFTLGEVEDYRIEITDNNPCKELLTASFEEGYGTWIDGGDDCTRVREYASNGEWSVRLRDDSGSKSSITSRAFDLTDTEKLTINFSYYANSMEDGEYFALLISSDGGQSYTTQNIWESGVDFTNENYYQENVVIDNIKFTNNTKIRLMCSASANADQIFIDDINVLKCSEVDSSEQDIKVSISDKGEELNDLSFEALQQKNAHGLDQVEIEIYPNPSQDAVFFSSNNSSDHSGKYSIQLLDMHGEIVASASSIADIDTYVFDITVVPDGMYFLIIQTNNLRIDHHKILISK